MWRKNRRTAEVMSLIHSEDFISANHFTLSVPVFNVTQASYPASRLEIRSLDSSFDRRFPPNLNTPERKLIPIGRHCNQSWTRVTREGPPSYLVHVLHIDPISVRRIGPQIFGHSVRGRRYFSVIEGPKEAKMLRRRLQGPRCNLWRAPSRRRSSRNPSASRATKDLG